MTLIETIHKQHGDSPRKGQGLHVALALFDWEGDPFEIGPGVLIRPFSIHEDFNLQAATFADETSKYKIYTLIRYASSELAIDGKVVPVFNDCILVTYLVSLALRIISRSNFLMPFASTLALDKLGGGNNDRALIHFLEEGAFAKGYGKSNPAITDDHLRWVRDNMDSLGTVFGTKRFDVAAAAFTTATLNSTHETVAANLWMGIDALFGMPTANNARSSMFAASYLSPRGKERFDKFKDIEGLFSQRNDIIHGSLLDAPQLVEHVTKARELLASALTKIVEVGFLPGTDDFLRYTLSDS